MTPDELTARLPALTNNPLPIKPPFVFNRLSSRVFPLRAHLGTLQRVVDGYLNFVPPEAGYFRVPLPYVYVMVLDYGQVAESVARIGWFAQTEVFFLVPLEWYRFIGGQWVFYDWAVITPYVFVNDDFSVPLGRTVFGFPKVLARVTQSPSTWIKDATSPVTLARIETGVFPQTYSGVELQNRVLLEVERNTMSNLRVPFDVAGASMPWSIASNFAQAVGGFSRDALWLAQSMRLSPLNPGADPGVMQAMMARMAPWFAPGGPGFVQNSINLKQFRRSDNPSQVCYQALTNGRMEVRAFNGAGLLGEYEVMLGDVSGGHTVRLFEYASLPLVRTLGLEVDREWLGPDCRVTELKPVMPYWLDVDIQYDQGDNLAWRLSDGIWRDGGGAEFPSQPKPKGAEAPAFNSTVTTVIDDIAGPFDFSDTTVRVLPLLADTSKLQRFVDRYLNDAFKGKDSEGFEQRVRFDVWSRPHDVNPDTAPGDDLAYVYLMVSSFGNVISNTNNVGDWTNYQLSFMIPVQFKRKNPQGDLELLGVGLVPAFSFVDNCVAAIARLEVQGFEATVANFFKPASVWLSDQVELNANPQQTLLRMDTEVWPAFGQGQKAVVQPLVEICQGEPDAGLGTSPDAPWKWAETLRGELLAKKKIKNANYAALKIGRALALELLGNEMPFTAYALKQFRDARDPSKACYQSLVRVPRLIKELDDLREIEETLVVRIHNFPSLDIVGELGLVAAGLPSAGEGIISTAQAIRPFFIRGMLHEPLAQRLGFRAGGEKWKWEPDDVFATLLSDADGAPQITADLRAETLQDQIDPSRISAIMYQAGQRRKQSLTVAHEGDEAPISKEQAREALMALDPQTVIECILSREWGNRDVRARWRQGRGKLMDALAALPLVSKTEAYPESVLYRKINNELAEAPGAVAAPMQIRGTYYASDDALAAAIAAIDAQQFPTPQKRWAATMEKIILTQERFTRWRLQMESTLSEVSAMTILKPAGLEEFYEKNLNQNAPGTMDVVSQGLFLWGALEHIGNLEIEGEPSDRNNLDTQVLADKARLQEMLQRLKESVLAEDADEGDEHSGDRLLQWALEHAGEFRQVVDFARAYCDAQYQAFLNKLSRAFQKPDFCIRRDAVCGSCDQFLPLSLSWDEDWYYGRNVDEIAAGEPPLSAATGANVKDHGVPDGNVQGTGS